MAVQYLIWIHYRNELHHLQSLAMNSANRTIGFPLEVVLHLTSPISFFEEDQTSANKIDRLLEIMVDLLDVHNDDPPFADYQDVYSSIDEIPIGGVPLQSF